jgi:hypothetical protein
MGLTRYGKTGSITFIDYSGTEIANYYKDTLRARIDFGKGINYTG